MGITLILLKEFQHKSNKNKCLPSAVIIPPTLPDRIVLAIFLIIGPNPKYFKVASIKSWPTELNAF